jgi:hypothetical protein
LLRNSRYLSRVQAEILNLLNGLPLTTVFSINLIFKTKSVSGYFLEASAIALSIEKLSGIFICSPVRTSAKT